MEVEIANYLAKISESELSASGSRNIRAMFEIIDDIESIADLCFHISNSIVRKKESKVAFSDKMTQKVLQMFDLIDAALAEMIKNLDSEYSDVNPSNAFDIENKINKYRNQLREEHLQNVKAGKYKYKTGVIYSELFLNSERMGDYIINVTEAIESTKKLVTSKLTLS